MYKMTTTEEEHNVNGSASTHKEIKCFQNDECEKSDLNAFADFSIDLPIDVSPSDVRLNNNKSPSASKIVEKLRISIPPMASPSSYYSSSSESHSPAHTLKVRKRYCYTCEIRFKHTADLLAHLRRHVSQPLVELTRVDETNPFYQDYLNRERESRKRAASTELNAGPLKIRLRIPSNNETRVDDASQQEGSETVKRSNSQPKEGSIRILTAQEIKLSPPRMMHDMPSDAMVSMGSNPFNNNSVQRHFECPPLDGLSQFIDETATGESTEQLLRKLLENTDTVPESNNFDPPSNEFISIENLAHMCSVCRSSFPNSNLLNEHKRQTGHGINEMSILEPIQEMIVEPLLPFPHRPQSHINRPHEQQFQMQQQQQQMHHQRLQQQQQQQQHEMRQMHFGPPSMQVGSYGQPPVLPIDQMSHQVRNFQNNPTLPPPPMSQAQRFGPMQFPVRRQTPPPLYRSNPVPNQNNHAPGPNQPMNMAPFMSMSPEMYNPQPSNQPPPPNMSHPNPFANSQLANRLMQMPQSRLRSRLTLPPTMNQPRPNFVRPFMPPAPSTVPTNNFSPPLDLPNGRIQNAQRPNPVHFASRVELQRPKENSRQSPIISMAPPSAGLPIIQSVQSGATVTETSRFQLSNQITLSVKPKENSSTSNDSNAANNAVNILANRGILIKPTGKPTDSATTSNKSESPKSLKCGTAEEAVQKLQLNNSVSIISKKKSSPSTDAPTTIDLSIDEDKESETTIRKAPALVRKATIKCPIKSCNARFVNVIALRQHTRGEHRLSSRPVKCAICATEFPSSVELRIHHLKEHQRSQLGIPVVDLRKARTCHKLLELGIVNFIPIENYTRHTDNADIGLALPIISIDGSSKSSLLNLLGADELSMLPLNKMRPIPKPMAPATQRKPEQTTLRMPERIAQQTSEKSQLNISALLKKTT